LFFTLHHYRRWFDQAILLAIIVNCIFLALDEPVQGACCGLETKKKEATRQFCAKMKWSCNENRQDVLQIAEFFFTLVFIFECSIKIVALNLLPYLRDGWCVALPIHRTRQCSVPHGPSSHRNLLDFVIVAASIPPLIGEEIAGASALRALRAFRPLRTVKRIPGLRVLVETIFAAIPHLTQVASLCLFLFFMFGIIGVEMWKGQFRNRCFPLDEERWAQQYGNLTYDFRKPIDIREVCDPTTHHCTYEQRMNVSISPEWLITVPEYAEKNLQGMERLCSGMDSAGHHCPAGMACVSGFHNPNKDFSSYDNILNAFVLIFQVVSLTAWTDLMYFTQDLGGMPTNLYYIAVVFLGAFFFRNLLVAVIMAKFEEAIARKHFEIEQKAATLALKLEQQEDASKPEDDDEVDRIAESLARGMVENEAERIASSLSKISSSVPGSVTRDSVTRSSIRMRRGSRSEISKESMVLERRTR
jgi:hypothetical protein